MITVEVASENDVPTISGDQTIAVDEGQSVVLTVADFVGADLDNATSTLTHSVSATTNGSVQRFGTSVSSFTHADLVAGYITFLHDGSESTTGGFDVSAVDPGNAVSTALTITATVTLQNDAPELVGDFSATISEGETYTLTLADLGVLDPDSADADLQFIISEFANGRILVDGSQRGGFSYTDLLNGLVAFQHDFTTPNDGSFNVSVTDGEASSIIRTVTLTVDGPLATDGGDGSETIRGGELNNFIRGFGGDDRIDGFGGNDILFGNAGNDTLVGGGGDDILNGGEGDDRLFGGEGADTLIGRGGTDLASYKNAATAIVLDLSNTANNTGDAAGDTYDSIERYEGSRFADTMTGTIGADYLLGGDGNDVINGSDGNDLLFGDAGNDTLNGGADQDVLRGGEGDDTLNGDTGNDVLRGEDGSDVLNGGSGNDTLYGGADDDILDGGDGNDVFVGGAGGDRFTGGDGNDRVTYTDATSGVTIDLTNAANSTGIALGDTFFSIETIQGSDFDDIFVGTAAQDRLFGLDGGDTMDGGLGNDLLEGGNGADILNGGGDADILRGGSGDDILTGGTGKDRFQFGENEGADTITDFNQTELDRMQFTNASGVESMADMTIVQQGSDTLITYAEGTIVLENFTATDLTSADFSFL